MTTTILRYDGELGTDLWALGEGWGILVARTWENTVRGRISTSSSRNGMNSSPAGP